MPVHQRHADRRIGIEHLLGGNHFDLIGIDIEAKLTQGDLAHGVVGLSQQVEIPFRAIEQGPYTALASRRQLGVGQDPAPQVVPALAENNSWNTGKMSSAEATRRMAKFFLVRTISP